MNRISSILLIHKEPGITSFSSLYPIKRGIDKKVGHAGTLDKFAQGLMIVLTGACTKLNPLFSSLDKQYLATIRFGEETDTLDPEGTVIKTGPIPDISLIEKVLQEQFSQEIAQIPPIYSAIHVQGKRAYQLARSEQSVALAPRPVTIFNHTICNWDPPYLTLHVHCSKGTYIRSLSRDIAIACGTRAYTYALTRTHIGPFSLQEAITTESIDDMIQQESLLRDRLLRLERFGQLVIDSDAESRLTFGNMFSESSIITHSVKQGDAYALVESQKGELLAIVELSAQLLPKRILTSFCVGKI